MPNTLINSSEQLYAFLLRFYPSRFQEQFGNEMRYVFSESLREAYTEQKEHGVMMLWLRTIIDGAKSFITQHIENFYERRSMSSQKTVAKSNQDLVYIAMGSVAILLFPLIGMQFSSEVDWNMFDFIVMGVLLASMSVLYAVLSRMTSDISKRIFIGLVVLTLLMLIWAELAVGIFGTPFAGS